MRMTFSKAMFTVLGVTLGFTLPVDALLGFSLSLMYGESDSSSTCVSGRSPM